MRDPPRREWPANKSGIGALREDPLVSTVVDATIGLERFACSRALQARAHGVIPGGAHTYAKGDDQYPELAPGFIERGHGCHVWDVDGNEYIEYGMGLRAVTLGHAHPAVNAAAVAALNGGLNFTRPSTIELECAEKLLSFLPRADMVKFAKNGSDATTAAVKLARAYTGRDVVAICGDQPFFSVDDWFIGMTPVNAGIPELERALTLKFRYNDAASLATLFETQAGRIACVILEAATVVEPRAGFLQQVRALCDRHGALLVLDEMITGFRWDLGGAQSVYDVTPDLSAFGKALGNGFAVSALCGRREIMERGGLDHPHERVFLLSTTHGAETLGLAAALATMTIYEREPVIETLHRQGDRLRSGVKQAMNAAGVSDANFDVLGRSSNLIYATRDADGKPSQEFRTLFMQELIRGGVLGPSFVVSYAHSDADIDRTVDIVHEALKVYRSALNDGVMRYLTGRSVKPVYRTHN
jgi:glutamate-1-semialdehyde 2,1-aminomutase